MLNNMLDLIDKEKDVVLDASFYTNKIREPFLNCRKTTLAIIEVWADENIIKLRLEKTRPYSEADFEVYQLLKQQWEPLEQPHLILESGDIDNMLSRAVKYLQDVKKAD
jgi:predicted kinase